MRERKRILIMLLATVMTGIFVWLVVLPGCDSVNYTTMGAENAELKKQVAELETRIATLIHEGLPLDYYLPGVTVVRRGTPPPPGMARKKVWVYVDGLLTDMFQYDLDYMIERRFFIVTVVRPGVSDPP